MSTAVTNGTVAGLRARVAELDRANTALQAELDRRDARIVELEGQLARRDAAIELLEGRIEGLQGKLALSRRASKRQAAPFSKGEPTDRGQRGRPGRKPGADYGPRSWRRRPPRVDEVVEVGLPEGCPDCGGELEEVRVACQWQAELPTTPHFVQFNVHIGRCVCCDGRVQPRHVRQTSDALGAAASQLGPRAVGLAVLLNKQCGVSTAKIATLYGQLGVAVTPGGITHAVARAAEAATPTYQALVEGIRASPVVAADETGWKVDADKAWLWTFVGDLVTVYRIADGRGFAQAADVLGEGFDGIIERDGWAPYRSFTDATHQTCLAHLLRRVHGLIDAAYAGQARTPHAVKRILQAICVLRERRERGEVTDHDLAVQVAELGARLDTLIGGATSYPPNRKLLNHLAAERQAIFTCLTHPGVQATNWRAEQAIRPMAVARKAWGGNRTRNGADTHQTLASVLTTARQQQRDPLGLLVGLQTDPDPGVAPQLTIPTRARSS